MSGLREFAARYTAAWCRHDAAAVAAFFSPNGSLTINRGAPSVGRGAIAEAAQGFMTAFRDLEIHMDALVEVQGKVFYQWTLEGTRTGPGGTGRGVRISGFEEWRIGEDGLVAESLGNFDAAEYARQLEHGVDPGKEALFDPEDIRAAEHNLVALLLDPDVEKRVTAYAADAVFLIAGTPPVHGREEMQRRPKRRLSSAALTPLSTLGNGRLACVYGLFTCVVGKTATGEGDPVAVRFLIVWRKEPDGVWRIAREFLVPESGGE